MRDNRARQIMRNARKSEKQMRRFLAQQSSGLTEEESQLFAADALAEADEQQGRELTDDNYASKFGMGLIKMRRRRG